MPSTVIKRFLYDAHAETLAITFPSGKTYLYFNVPKGVYDAFSQAGSRGAYFNDYIRDRFEFREMD